VHWTVRGTGFIAIHELFGAGWVMDGVDTHDRLTSRGRFPLLGPIKNATSTFRMACSALATQGQGVHPLHDEAVMNGRSDDLVDLARTNIIR
jgi:hypothetical protein